MDHYKTIKSASQGLYKEKGSKFLSFTYRIGSEGDVEKRLAQLRKEYHDARHHCYGYIIGTSRSIQRSNDDGEPRHSAGDPILNQIRSRELTNVLVVVVRYFGGTKLGKSGLIQAYKTAAEEALERSSSTIIELTSIIKLRFPFEKHGDVQKLIGQFNIEITDEQYDQHGYFKGKIKKSEKESFLKSVSLFKDINCEITVENDH